MCKKPGLLLLLFLLLYRLKLSDTFRETLGFGFTIQDNAIPPRNSLKYIIKNPNTVTDARRLCGSSSETIQHGTTSSQKVAQITY